MGDKDIKERVKQILLEHQGTNNPISSREINEKLDIDPPRKSSNIRELVSELVLEEDVPVAANPHGYYLIQDEKELEEYVEELETRAESINKRKLEVQHAVGAAIYEGESRNLELKDKRSDSATVVKELVALGNTEGGTVVVGVNDQNDIPDLQFIDNPGEWEESVNQCLVARTDPQFNIEFSSKKIGDKRIIMFKVDEFSTLRTFDPGNQKPCIPHRAGTTTTYLAGSEIARFYQ